MRRCNSLGVRSVKRFQDPRYLGNVNEATSHLDAESNNRPYHLVTEGPSADGEYKLVTGSSPLRPLNFSHGASVSIPTTERREVVYPNELLNGFVHRPNIQRCRIGPHQRSAHGIVDDGIAYPIPVCPPGGGEPCMEVVIDDNEAPRCDLGREQTVQRPESLPGIELLTRERHDLLRRMDTLIRSAGYVRLDTTGVRSKSGFERSLHTRHVRLDRVAEELRAVIRDIEPIRRHGQNLKILPKIA